MSHNLVNHRETEIYRKQLRQIIDKSCIEQTSEEQGTFAYVCEKYGPNYIRLKNLEDGQVYILDHTNFEKKLKFYNMDFAEFFTEINRIHFTMFF